MRHILGARVPAGHGMPGRMRWRRGHRAYGGAQVIEGDQRIPTLGDLQDALPEECHAGLSIALALQEFQPMDLGLR
jgi:hypothetical protein